MVMTNYVPLPSVAFYFSEGLYVTIPVQLMTGTARIFVLPALIGKPDDFILSMRHVCTISIWLSTGLMV